MVVEEKRHILIADDDKEDCKLAERALQKNAEQSKIDFVHDGQELLSYLRREGEYATLEKLELPGLILLDLNMPCKDGREALAEIKGDETLKNIPIVVMTTSTDSHDIMNTYGLGANSFITKPSTFPHLVETMDVLTNFWFDLVQLPNKSRKRLDK